jgi:Cytochrome c554 and c-prime
MRRAPPWTALVFALLAASGVAACQGCQTPPTPPTTPGDAAAAKAPTVRLYISSNIAGAMEPCGCSKDQLGGIDHLAAYIAAEKASAPNSLLLGAGPMLFMEPSLKPDSSAQDTWKAEAIALSAKDMGLVAWAPGMNDWAAGPDVLAASRDGAGAKLLGGNLEGKPGGFTGSFVRDVGGVKVGVVGVADPKDRAAKYPDGVKAGAALDAMKAGLAEVKKQGAEILVGVAAIPRGEALRLADNLPELHVLVVGEPVQMGDANDAAKAPILAGSTLVVETANHLQTVGVVDLFVRGHKPGAPIVFADAGGVAKADALLALAGRIRDLEARINSWANDRSVKPEDVAARKADLEKLRAEKAKMEADQPAVEGSFFRYASVEVRDKLGRDKAVADRMLGYYKRVNDHNKVAFADRKPDAPEAGKAGYVGVEKCTECHDDARKVWDGTPHAHAYATLQQGFKEYNLDCTSCHVTGYGKPGGSTVTFNEKLQNVQCEECHGPGSLHIKDPKKKDLLIAKPKPESCVSGCHHPPHVEGFDAAAKMKLILGPGHGA